VTPTFKTKVIELARERRWSDAEAIRYLMELGVTAHEKSSTERAA
jgi:hypothetical protein